MTDRPLFIPLKAEHYNDYEEAKKIIEFRQYGPRWNERTCYVGREVILSKGYGKMHRLQARIHAVHIYDDARGFIQEVQEVVQELYGSLDKKIIAIEMIDVRPQVST